MIAPLRWPLAGLHSASTRATASALLGGWFVMFLAAPLPAVVVAVGAAVYLAGLHSISLAIGCVLVSIPIQDAGAVTVGSVSLTWTKIVVAAAVGAWCLSVLADPTTLRLDSVSVAFAASVVVLLATVVNAEDFEAWAGEAYRWGIALVIYQMAKSAIREQRFPAVLLVASSVSVIGASVIGLGQVITGAGPPSFEARGLTRAFGAFGEPNPFAAYFEMTVPLFLAVILGHGRDAGLGGRATLSRSVWRLVVSAAVVGTVTLIFTQSRGGLLGFAGGVTAILILAGGWKRVAAIAGIVLALTFLLSTPLRSSVWDGVFGGGSTRQVTSANFSVQERSAHWRTGLAMVRAYPVLGVGAGNFTSRYREFAQVWRFRISRGHAHNTYIHVAAQSGLVGLASYVGLLATVTIRLARAYQRVATDRDRALVVGAIGVTVAIALHGMVDYLHVLSLGLQLSVVWAIASIGDRADAGVKG